jgi:hypothetical protein
VTHVLVVVRGGFHHLVSDFGNWENWEFDPYWLDVDTDAYGVVVLGYDSAVVVVVFVVVVVAVSALTVSVTLLELLIQTLAFQLMLFGFHGMDQNLNHPLQISLPEVPKKLAAYSYPVVCMNL